MNPVRIEYYMFFEMKVVDQQISAGNNILISLINAN